MVWGGGGREASHERQARLGAAQRAQTPRGPLDALAAMDEQTRHAAPEREHDLVPGEGVGDEDKECRGPQGHQ